MLMINGVVNLIKQLILIQQFQFTREAYNKVYDLQ